MPSQRSQEQRTAETRAALLAAARDLLGTRPFADIPATEITARAGVTRGALYHHYPTGKPDLFRALLVQAQEEIERAVLDVSRSSLLAGDDPITAMIAGARAYLDALRDPALARIMVLDGPVVLGWEEWSTIDAAYGVRQVMLGVEILRALDVTLDLPQGMFARMYNAAIVEAARAMLFSHDPAPVREEGLDVLRRFLVGAIRPGRVDANGALRWEPQDRVLLARLIRNGTSGGES